MNGLWDGGIRDLRLGDCGSGGWGMATTGLTGWEVVADGAVSSGAVSSGAVTAVTVYEDGAGVGDARGFERALFGAQLVRAAVSAESQRRVVWQELIADWLTLKASRSGSAHTRRNYEAAVLRWQEFLATQFVDDPDGAVRTCEMWEVDHGHVRGVAGGAGGGGVGGEFGESSTLVCVLVLFICHQ